MQVLDLFIIACFRIAVEIFIKYRPEYKKAADHHFGKDGNRHCNGQRDGRPFARNYGECSAKHPARNNIGRYSCPYLYIPHKYQLECAADDDALCYIAKHQANQGAKHQGAA